MSRSCGIAFAAVLAFGALTTSASADGIIRRDVQVRYGDLNISTEPGADTLLARIDQAARHACGGSPYFDPMYSMMPDKVTSEFDKCQHDAVARAVSNVGSPALTHAYADKGQKPFQHVADR